MTQTPEPDGSSSTSYVIEAENAAEMARLMIQDRLLTQAMGGVLAEQQEISRFHHILDIGCGPGGWLLEVAEEYPQIQGLGIDSSAMMIAYASSLAQTRHLQNVQFRVMDATTPLDLAGASYELINGRILSGFLSTSQWPILLAQCARLTRPAGVLRLTEPEFGFTTSPALDAFTGLAAQALYRAGYSFSPSGRTFGTTPMLRRLLEQAGYEHILQQAHIIDYSAGTPLHQSNVQNLLVVYSLLQPFLLQMQVSSSEELTQLYEQMKEEIQRNDFCGIDYYLTVWGTKAATDSSPVSQR